MTYDDYKQQSPPEAKENHCVYCGEECNGSFCDKECRKAYESEN